MITTNSSEVVWNHTQTLKGFEKKISEQKITKSSMKVCTYTCVL